MKNIPITLLPITLYGLKNCDTCRKAIKSMKVAEYDLTVMDIRADGVPDDVLKQAIARYGDAVLNRKSTTWRGLGDDIKKEPIEVLLRDHPTLIKRPLIVQKGQITIGWDANTRGQYGVD